MRRPPLILLYHGFGSVQRQQNRGNLMIEPDRFMAHIAAIRERGYRFEVVSQIAHRLRAGVGLDGLCALTFDEGLSLEEGVVTEVFEQLREPVSIYVCPGLDGVPHYDLGERTGIRLPTRAELQAMARLPNVEIGSHTNEHVSLATATEDEAHREMAESKAALEDLIERPVTTFAYPWCTYSAACPAAAERAGYAAAVTCGARGSWSPYEIPRVNIGGADGPLMLALKVRGLYSPLRNSWLGRAAHRIAGSASPVI